MAVTSSPRLGITRWSAGTDPYTRAQQDGDHATLDDLAAIDAQGTLAARPAAGTRGRYYWATDVAALFRDDGAAWTLIGNPPQQEVFGREGTLITGTGKSKMPMLSPGRILGVQARVNTAPTGASVIVDVNKNGGTIFTTQGNRPTIAASALASGVAVPDTQAFVAGDYLSIDIDQVGSTVAGADLLVAIRYIVTGI